MEQAEAQIGGDGGACTVGQLITGAYLTLNYFVEPQMKLWPCGQPSMGCTRRVAAGHTNRSVSLSGSEPSARLTSRGGEGANMKT